MDAVDSGVALLLLDVAAAKRHLKEARQACRDTQLCRDAGAGTRPQGEQSLLDQLRALHEENLRLRTRLTDEQQARRKLEEDYAELTTYMRAAQGAEVRRGWQTPTGASPAHQQQHSSSLAATPAPGPTSAAAAAAAEGAGAAGSGPPVPPAGPHSSLTPGMRPYQQHSAHSAYFGDATCTSPAAHPVVTSPCSGSLPSPCRLLSPSPPNCHAQHSPRPLASAAAQQQRRALQHVQQGQQQQQRQRQRQDLLQHQSRALWRQAEAAHLPLQHTQGGGSAASGVHASRPLDTGSTGGGDLHGVAGGCSSWHPAAGHSSPAAAAAAAAATRGPMGHSRGGSSDSSSSLEELVGGSLIGVMSRGGGTSSAASRLAQLLVGTATAATTTNSSSSSSHHGRSAQQLSAVFTGEQQAAALRADGQAGVQQGSHPLWASSKTTNTGSIMSPPWQARTAAPGELVDSPLRSAAAWLAAGGGPAAAGDSSVPRWHQGSSTLQQHLQQASPAQRQYDHAAEWEEGLSGTDSDVSEEQGDWHHAPPQQRSTPPTAQQGRPAPVSLQQMEQLQAELAARMQHIRQQLINISGGMGAESSGTAAHGGLGARAAGEAGSHAERPQHLGSPTSPEAGVAGAADGTAAWLQQAGWHGSAYHPGTGASRDGLGHVELEALLQAHWPEAAAAAAAGAAAHDSAAAGRPVSSSSRAYDSACSSDWEGHWEEDASPDLLQAAAGWPAAARQGQPHLQQGQQGMAAGGQAGSTEHSGLHRGDVYSAPDGELQGSSTWRGQPQEGCDHLSALRATRSLPTL